MAVTNSGMTLYTDNDTQQSWSASDGLDTEVFIQGVGSESWLVGKNSNETSTLTLAATMTGAKYFSFWMKSDLSAFYSQIDCTLSDGTNSNLFTAAVGSNHPTTPGVSEISGDFKPSMLQMTEGSAGGTYNPTNHASVTVNVDNSNSGNIRAITNHWIDAMYYGTGRTITGTTASDALFKESDDLDKSNDSYDGCSEFYNGITFFQTDVSVGTTTGNSFGEVVVFRYARSTDNLYSLDITGTADFLNTSIIGAALTSIDLDSSTATAFSMSGGGISGAGATVFATANTISNVVFTDRTSLTIPNALAGCSINTSGLITLTGSMSGSCTVNSTTATAGVLTTDLAKVGNTHFISDGSSHAVELSSIGAGSMVWSGTESGYVTGATGSPVTPTSTGNETIYVNVATASDLTINVATGASTPSVRVGASFTGSVNVVAGQVTATFNVSPSVTNYEYAIYTVTSLGSLAGATEVQHVETHNSATFAYTYTYAASTFIAVQLLFGDGSVNDYEESISYYTLAPSDQTITINLEADNNN